MKQFFSFLMTGVAALAAGSGPLIAADGPTRAVVELFTSQGCSSCPPADALFQKLAQDKSIITLSFPVDYWDYLGWKDTFAKADFTARQRAYAATRGDRDVYTPQAVINGRDHVVGSDADGINRSVMNQAKQGNLSVPLKLEMVGDALVARIGASTGTLEGKATVWLVKYCNSETVSIGRGENSGRTVTYSHVVTDMQPIGMWKGQEKTLELPRGALTNSKEVGYVLILQANVNGKPGPILGAATVDDASPL